MDRGGCSYHRCYKKNENVKLVSVHHKSFIPLHVAFKYQTVLCVVKHYCSGLKLFENKWSCLHKRQSLNLYNFKWVH